MCTIRGSTLRTGDLTDSLGHHTAIERRETFHVEHITDNFSPIELGDLIIQAHPLQDLEHLHQRLRMVVW